MSSVQNLIKTLFLFSVIIIASGSITQAQTTHQAFEHLNFSLTIQNNINRNVLHDYWSHDPAIQLDIETPFYAGDFFAGGRFTSFSNRENGLPDYDNIQTHVGWGMKHPIVKGLKIGANTGLLFSMMRFKNVSDEHQERAEKRFGSTSPESEIGFIIGANISYSLSDTWSVQLLWNRNVIYTRHKMKLNYVGIGLSRRLITPAWLKGILE